MNTRNSSLREEITQANGRFMAAFPAGDSESLAQLYTQDGQLLPAGGDVVSGQQAIQRFWQAVMDSGIKQAKLETVEQEDHGDTALEVGRYVLGGADGQQLDRGKYIVIWKREGGSWKVHRDIWTSSVPVG